MNIEVLRGIILGKFMLHTEGSHFGGECQEFFVGFPGGFRFEKKRIMYICIFSYYLRKLATKR
jgi:hypothetical protein